MKTDDQNRDNSSSRSASRVNRRASPSTKIAEFYQKYPYPKVDLIEYDFNLLDHFQYLASQCMSYELPRRAPLRTGRMLIAGCGTREAVMWAFSLPHYQVDAIDLSARSLSISEALADQLKLTNIRFIHANFELGEGIEGPYDFVHSFGVLHHLKSPERGLAQLEAALAPGGLISLMVYNDANRIAFQRAQRVISLLTDGVEPNQKLESAHEVVQRGAQTSNRLTEVFQNALREYQGDPAQFADTMLNPQEVSYTIPSLVDFLASAGLELCSPARPMDWQAQMLFTPEQRQRLNQLPLIDQMELCDHLQAPLFWVLARRHTEAPPPRPCSGDATLFWDLVISPLETGHFPVVKLALQPPQPLEPHHTFDADECVHISRGARSATFTYHKIAWEMFKRFDGARSLREVGGEAARLEGVLFEDIQESLEVILRELIDLLALGTPDFSQCKRCPLRRV